MPFMVLPIALVLAALCALLNLWLGIRVGSMRGREKISIGDGGSEPLIRRMRAQANFVENAPFVLALVALIELCAGSSIWLAIIAALFVAGRIFHAFGMDGWMRGRMIGTVVSMVVAVILAVWAIAIPIAALRAGERVQSADMVVPAG